MIGILNVETARAQKLRDVLAGMDADARLITGAADVERAARVIIPHCDSIRAAARSLRDDGLVAPLLSVCDSNRPLLAVSSGLHMLMDVIHDEGQHTGLGVLNGKSIVFDFGNHPAARHFVLPHQGWNQVHWTAANPLLTGLESGEYFYFDHALHAEPLDSNVVAATCNHGVDFAALLATSHVFATQFLPEKSEEAGARILENFLRL